MRGHLRDFAKDVLLGLLAGIPVSRTVHGRDLRMPWSHGLPRYMAKYPLYDRLPARLAAFLRQRRGKLSGVDVGANVGDSLAAFGVEPGETWLAVEPHPKFLSYLQRNWGHAENVLILACACSSTSRQEPFAIRSRRGTASLRPEARGSSIPVRTLDDLLAAQSEGTKPDLLKIDTDGHDFEVISGARRTLARCRPALLFECDAFGNGSYVEDALETLEGLTEAGYRSCLVYDNLGHLMGRCRLEDRPGFADLLLYQLTGPVDYFDLLTMEEEDLKAFHEAEREFFAENVADGELRPMARIAASRVRGCFG